MPVNGVINGYVSVAMDWFAALETSDGLTYVDVREVICVSPPMRKGAHPESRVLCLRGNQRVYVLNTAANMAQLPVPADAHEHHAAVAVPKVKVKSDQPVKRGRKKAQP